MRRRSAMFGLAITLALAGGGFASESQKKPVVLTIQKKDGSQIDLTMADIEALPRQVFRTVTPWHDGSVQFEGAQLSAVFDLAGIKTGSVQVEALNGYRTRFPVSDAKEKPVILAYKRDGSYMPVRDKGPLFIVYNFDSSTELQSERYYARSAWQTRSMIEQ